MIRFFGDSLWHGRPARDLCASTGGTPMSQCEPDPTRLTHPNTATPLRRDKCHPGDNALD
jgi:hypothetical protein